MGERVFVLFCPVAVLDPRVGHTMVGRRPTFSIYLYPLPF